MGPNVSLSVRVLIDLTGGLLFVLFFALFFVLAMLLGRRATDDKGAKSSVSVRGRAPLFLAEAVEPHHLTTPGGLVGVFGRGLGGVGIGRRGHHPQAWRLALMVPRGAAGGSVRARRRT